MTSKTYIPWRTTYDPARWKAKRRVLRFALRTVGFPLLARMGKVEGVERVPREGRVILMFNHIAFIDPIAVLHACPRDAVPMMKAEALAFPFIGYLPRWWGVVPIWRGEVDLLAIRQSLAVLEAEEPLLIAPEGTRSNSLLRGKLGMAYLAARAQAPVVPVAVEGTQGFPTWPLSPRWWGEKVSIRFGRPFRFTVARRNPNRRLLQQMTDEAMYILAAMLPPHRRGYYADLSRATRHTIRWLDEDSVEEPQPLRPVLK